MAAGKQAVVWQDGDGELIITVVASDKAVNQQRTEIDKASGFEFLGVATVLNVDSSRARRAPGDHANSTTRATSTIATGDLL